MTNLPITGQFEITCQFGRVSSLHPNGHRGVDFSGRYKTTIYNVCNGVVVGVGYEANGFGNYVKVQDKANSSRVFYFAHLSKINVVSGQHLSRNSIIGVMGSTGRSTGRHLHFEMRVNNVACNPCEYLKIPNTPNTVYNSCNFQVTETAKEKAPLIKLRVNTLVSPLFLNSLDWNIAKRVKMPRGSICELVKEENADWWVVRYDGVEGYASTKYLTPYPA